MAKTKDSLNELLFDIKRITEHRVKLSDERIEKIYKQLDKDLTAFLAENYKKYADKDGRLYMKYLDANRKKAFFLNQIVENVDNLTPKLKAEFESLIDETYERCYKGMAESVKQTHTTAELKELVQDIDVNPDVLKQAVNNNISKLTLPAVLENHRAVIIYQIQRELVTGLTNGDRYETMSNRISERCNVSKGKANRIVRTEAHRNAESGFLDCAERIQEKMEDSDYIYAVTWVTMHDEKVRPQVRYKTKKGWKTKISKNGANHVKMDGQTVKVGEYFNLGGGVKAKAPSMSGDAKNDCNCRCTTEYNLMTVEEFAKATNQTVEQVKKKYMGGSQDEERLQKMYEEQQAILEKYGDETNMMLFGSTEDMMKYDEYKKELVNFTPTKKAEVDYIKQIELNDKRLKPETISPKHVTKEQADAISTYSRNGYVDMNMYKRFGNMPTEMPKEKMMREIKALDELLDNSLIEKEIFVKRGINENTLKALLKSDTIDIEKAIGKTINDKGYVSTTPYSTGGFGGAVRMYIKCPKGTRGAYIEKYAGSTEEREFLLASNQKFYIKDIKVEYDKWNEPHYSVMCDVIV